MVSTLVWLASRHSQVESEVEVALRLVGQANDSQAPTLSPKWGRNACVQSVREALRLLRPSHRSDSPLRAEVAPWCAFQRFGVAGPRGDLNVPGFAPRRGQSALQLGSTGVMWYHKPLGNNDLASEHAAAFWNSGSQSAVEGCCILNEGIDV